MTLVSAVKAEAKECKTSEKDSGSKGEKEDTREKMGRDNTCNSSPQMIEEEGAKRSVTIKKVEDEEPFMEDMFPKAPIHHLHVHT